MYVTALLPSKRLVVHEVAHYLDYRAGANRRMFSYGGVPIPGRIDKRGTETGGYWTDNVPGWERSGSVKNGYEWTLSNLEGISRGHAVDGPWEDFAETFTWSVMGTEKNASYDHPGQDRIDALDVMLDNAIR